MFESLTLLHVNNKSADQHVSLRNLISAISNQNAIDSSQTSSMQNFNILAVAARTGFESYSNTCLKRPFKIEDGL